MYFLSPSSVHHINFTTAVIPHHMWQSITHFLNLQYCISVTHIHHTHLQNPNGSIICLCAYFRGKGKVCPITGRKAHKVSRGIALLICDLGARRGWVVSTTPHPLYPWERPGTHCTGGWVGPRAGLHLCEKSVPPPGFDPWTVQPVASCYTDWAIPVCGTKVICCMLNTEYLAAIKTDQGKWTNICSSEWTTTNKN
jgi:hypothetical protein